MREFLKKVFYYSRVWISGLAIDTPKCTTMILQTVANTNI